MTANPRPRARGDRRGLTLVEVLLALAILGIAAGVLMMAVSRCLAVVRVSENYYKARRTLDLADLEHPVLVKKEDNQDKAINLDIGPVEYPDGFTFERKSERSSTLDDLMVVKNRVTWSTHGNQGVEEVVTYLYFTNDVTATTGRTTP